MKIHFVKIQTLVIWTILIILVIGFLSHNSETVTTSSPRRDLPIYSVDRADNKIALTFDVAWDNADITSLIDILDKHGIKSSFFIVGEWIDKYPDSVLALHNAGHEILNHSDTHPHINNLSFEEIVKEVQDCNTKITNLTGQDHKLFRPPYGEYNNIVISASRQADNFTIQWDVEGLHAI